MNRGEVWWVQFDPSIDSEIKKRRPGVILSNGIANKHLSRVVVVPITSNVDRVYPSEALISVTGKSAKAMADQIMAADKSRLDGRMATLSREDLVAVEQAVKLHLGMSPNT